MKNTCIADVMTHECKTIHNDLLAIDALAIMKLYHITSLVIVNVAQQPIGVLHLHDLLQAGIY